MLKRLFRRNKEEKVEMVKATIRYHYEDNTFEDVEVIDTASAIAGIVVNGYMIGAEVIHSEPYTKD